MKTIIAGSRTWDDYVVIDDTLAKFPHAITEVFSGGADGADKLGEVWAGLAGVPVRVFPYRRELGKAGGPARNTEMAENAEALIAFRSTGKSNGTDDMVKKAKARNLLVWVVNPAGQITVHSAQLELF